MCVHLCVHACVFIGMWLLAMKRCVCVCLLLLAMNIHTGRLLKCMTMQALFLSIVLHTNVVLIHSHSQVSPSLMCSLVDRVPEPKKTQPGRIQPFSAGPAELSVQEPAEDVSVILEMKSC